MGPDPSGRLTLRAEDYNVHNKRLQDSQTQNEGHMRVGNEEDEGKTHKCQEETIIDVKFDASLEKFIQMMKVDEHRCDGLLRRIIVTKHRI